MDIQAHGRPARLRRILRDLNLETATFVAGGRRNVKPSREGSRSEAQSTAASQCSCQFTIGGLAGWFLTKKSRANTGSEPSGMASAVVRSCTIAALACARSI